MDTEEQTKQSKNSVLEQLGSFSLNLFALALLNRSLDISGTITGWNKEITSRWYYLAFLGIIILLIGLYIRLPSHRAQEWLIRNISYNRVLRFFKYLGWVIVLVLFGGNLIQVMQTDWAVIIGYICWGAALAILGLGISKLTKAKGRKNV